MNDMAERMERLHVAECALARYHGQVVSGDRTVDDLECAVMTMCVAASRRDLELVARTGRAAWGLHHAGSTFCQTAGRA